MSIFGRKSKSIKTILVADDNRFTLKMIKFVLSKRGYIVIGAEDGKKALELAREHNPDLLIIDIMMPEMDGAELFGILKTDKELRKSRVIISSNAENIDKFRNNQDLHPDAFAEKPYKMPELLALIKKLGG